MYIYVKCLNSSFTTSKTFYIETDDDTDPYDEEVADTPAESGVFTDKWASSKSPAKEGTEQHVCKDEEAFLPPYWISHYTVEKCPRVAVLVCLPTGVASDSTENIILSLDKNCTELVIAVKTHSFYTNLCMFQIPSIVKKIGLRETFILKNALETMMANMRGSVQDDLSLLPGFRLLALLLSQKLAMRTGSSLLTMRIVA